jgi:cob(I)alamin adenosyltransferase
VSQSPNPVEQNRGLLIVYTGQGKGKTTAALGMVFRALGRGLKVAVVQFIKGKWKTGERSFAEKLALNPVEGSPPLTFFTMGEGFTWESQDISKDKQAAQAAWARVKDLTTSNEYFLLVLDEITYAINYGFIPLDDVLNTLQNRPKNLNVVITGRQASPELIEKADLVSEMKNIKHPFEKGASAVAGVDF